MKKYLLILTFVIVNYTFAFDIELINNSNNALTYKYIQNENFNETNLDFLFAVDDYNENNLEYDIFESETDELNLLNFNDIEYKTSFNPEIQFLGLTRGVNLIRFDILLYRRDPISNKVYKIDSLIFSYEYSSTLFDNQAFKDIDFFSAVLNKEFIESLLNQNTEKNSYTIQDANSWFDKEKKYVKFFTHSDGIAKISHQNILSELQIPVNSDAKFLKIYNRGNLIKFYSTSNQLNNGFIYLKSNRANGDTTHFSHYHKEEAFFITFDNSFESDLLQLKIIPIQGDKLDKIYSTIHFEKDSIYGLGAEVLNTYTSFNEGWYWDNLVIDPLRQNVNNINFHLISFPVEEIELSLRYASNINHQGNTVFNEIDFELNDFKSNKYSNEGDYNDVISEIIPSNRTLNGVNNLILNSYKVLENDSQQRKHGVIGLDYIRMQGSFRPIITQDIIDFDIRTSNNSQIEIFGFHSDEVVLIGEEEIFFPKTQNKSLSIFDINSLGDFSISLGNIAQFANYGEFSAIYYNGKYNFISTNSTTEITKFINSYQNNGVFAFAYNSNENLKPEVVMTLNSKFNLNLQTSNTLGIVFTNNYEFIANEKFEIEFASDFFYSALIGFDKDYENLRAFDSKSIIEPELHSVNFNSLNYEKNPDFVFIYHKNFEKETIDYLEYRKEKFPNLEFYAVSTETLYDNYSYGNSSPNAYRDYLRYLYSNENRNIKYLYLIGDASWDIRKVSRNSVSDNYVLTYGRPASDYWFSLLDSDDDIAPDIYVSRLPVSNSNEVSDYLSKVKEYENSREEEWMKRYLYISGGDNQSEINNFRATGIGALSNFYNSTFCIDTNLVSKDRTDLVVDHLGNDIRKIVNDGVFWTTYLGHGSATTMEIRGWEGDKYFNKGKYGVVAQYSCNTSSFAEAQVVKSIGENFILQKDKGFIVSLGSTSTNWLAVDLKIEGIINREIRLSTIRQRKIMELFNTVKTGLADIGAERDSKHQFTYLGDPLLNLLIPDKNELFIYDDFVTILNDEGLETITDDKDSTTVKFKIGNIGIQINEAVEVLFIHSYNNNIDSLILNLNIACTDNYFELKIPTKDKIGEHKIQIHIDPNQKLIEQNLTNNNIEIKFSVFSVGLIAFDPQPNWNIQYHSPIFRFIDPLDSKNTYKFKILDLNNSLIKESVDNEIIISDYSVDWLPNITLDQNKRYKIYYKLIIDEIGEELSNWNYFHIHTNSELIELNDEKLVSFELNPLIDTSAIEFNNIKKVEDDLYIDFKDFSTNIFSAAGFTLEDRGMFLEVYENDDTTKREIYRGNQQTRGFNLVIIPENLKDSNIKVLNFDTWSGGDYDPPYLMGEYLVSYLTDSIKTGDYLLLGTADASFRVMQNLAPETSRGYIDSLDAILTKLGAEQNGNFEIKSSYALFTKYGFPETTIDTTAISDTVKINTSFRRYAYDANININNIGKAKRWTNMNFDNFDYNYTLEIYDSNNNLISDYKNTNNIDINNINENDISLRFSLSRERGDDSPMNFRKLLLEFVPLPELAINKNKTKFLPNIIERGYISNLKSEIKNLSLRARADSTFYYLQGIGNNRSDSLDIGDMIINQEENIEIQMNTTNFLSTNDFSLSTISKSSSEYYTFNNTAIARLIITEDTIKPTVKIYADNIEISDGSFVSKQPEFRIEMYDNSPLLVTSTESILSRINRRVQLEETTDFYNIEYVNDGDLKLVLTFIPDTELDYNDNSLWVAYKDASNNPGDTIDIRVFVNRNNRVENNISAPNPFFENTDIIFDFIGPENGMEVEIDIYSYYGDKVISLNETINIGKNKIEWDGKNIHGNSIAKGSYYYIIKLISGYAEPMYGKFIKID